MNRLRGCLGKSARTLALALLVVSPTLSRAQVLEPGWDSGYPLFGYGAYAYPGYSYGAPRFGYPFFVFPGLVSAYGYGYPGVYPYEFPVIASNPNYVVAPSPVASPRILSAGSRGQPQTEGQPQAEGLDQETPRVISGTGGSGAESGGRERATPPIYRGPPPTETLEGTGQPVP